MAARYYGGKITVPATATNLLDLLVAAEPTIKNIAGSQGRGGGNGNITTVRAGSSNTGNIYFGFEDNVTPNTSTVDSSGNHATAFIAANEAKAFAVDTRLYLRAIWLASANGTEVIFLEVIES